MFAVGALWLIVIALLALSIKRNQGHFIYAAARVIAKEHLEWSDAAAMALLALALPVIFIRYEGLFLICVVGALLLLRGRVRYDLTLGVLALVPVIVYGTISKLHGSFWLPNSVLLKGADPNHPAQMLNFALKRIVLAPHLIWLVSAATVLYVRRRRRGARSTISPISNVLICGAWAIARWRKQSPVSNSI